MSDTAPDTPDIPVDPEVDEFTQALFAAMESRSPVKPSADQAPETEPDAPGGEETVEGQEPSPPESAPEAPPEAPPPDEVPEEGEPEEGEAPGPESGQSAPAFTFSGRDYSNEQVAQALPVYDWFARLQPQQVQAIDALLSGGYRLVPANEPVVTPATPTGSVAPVAPPPPGSATAEEGEWLDPRAQREINALRQQMAQMQEVFTQNLAPVVQTQQQADYNTRLSAIKLSHAEFQERFQLPDEAMDALEATIAESQVLPGLANRHGSLKAGMDAALEMAFWSTPVYRDHFIEQRQASKEAEQATTDAATVRKQHLTALSGSGGSAPRREPVPSTPADRHAAMVSEIAQAMNGSGQVQ
jgi:hypothetical protein